VRIAIVGVGHMGSWLAKELAEQHEICVYDLDRSKAEKIQQATMLREYAELKHFQPEILMNAVSLQRTQEAFESARPYLPANCLISDMASVKSGVAEYYKRSPFRFVSVHPMFGPTFANVDKLENENVILISESDPEGARFFQEFFSRMGLHITHYSFEEHDQMIAYSLVLPFASTMVFAACMDTAAVPGSTFKKHREIAKGLLCEDDYLLTEILFSPHSLQQLEKVTTRLEFLKHVIKAKDAEEAQKFISRLRKNVL